MSVTSLLVADRNDRAAEFLEQEVRKLTEEERELKWKLQEPIRKMMEVAETRFVVFQFEYLLKREKSVE